MICRTVASDGKKNRDKIAFEFWRVFLSVGRDGKGNKLQWPRMIRAYEAAHLAVVADNYCKFLRLVMS